MAYVEFWAGAATASGKLLVGVPHFLADTGLLTDTGPLAGTGLLADPLLGEVECSGFVGNPGNGHRALPAYRVTPRRPPAGTDPYLLVEVCNLGSHTSWHHKTVRILLPTQSGRADIPCVVMPTITTLGPDTVISPTNTVLSLPTGIPDFERDGSPSLAFGLPEADCP